jgi:hypothetical protein
MKQGHHAMNQKQHYFGIGIVFAMQDLSNYPPHLSQQLQLSSMYGWGRDLA